MVANLPEESVSRSGDALAQEQWSAHVAAFAIIEIDSDGLVRTWNTGAERMKRFARDEILGEHFSVFYRDEDRRLGLPERLLSLAEKSGCAEDTGWRVRATGELFWAYVSITRIRDKGGRTTGFVKIVRDLTSEKRAADELNSFLRAFAHDFMSPVTAARGYVDLLADSPHDRHDLLARLSGVTEHLVQMTTALSERVRSTPVPPRVEPTDVGESIREAASLVLPGDLHDRLSLITDANAVVLADPTQLRRAFQNVIQNAAKYSSAPILARVHATSVLVCVIVEDNGRGIHPEDLVIVREEGERGRLSSIDEGGSGIGLPSAVRAIERYGGTLEIESEVDRGTTVRIYLPRYAPT